MKYYNKKVEFNIVNLKSVVFNTDLFTKILSIKLKNNNVNVLEVMKMILNKTSLPKESQFKEKFDTSNFVNFNLFNNKFIQNYIGSILTKNNNNIKFSIL
jgi:hypothetical protein